VVNFTALNLSKAFRGTVITPDNAWYGTARSTFNGMVNREPAAIAYCRSEEDVAYVVDAAVNAGVPLTVRSTGHSVSGRCIADGAIIVDVSPMSRVIVEQSGSRIVVGGGATWRATDAECEKFGVAVTGGTVSSTGVAGLTLGGGIGWLLPSFGLACDSLTAARVVTSDARVIAANDDDTPDLMSALRGSGFGRGVITEFTFAANRLLPIVGGSIYVDLAYMHSWLDPLTEVFRSPPTCLMLSPSFSFWRDQPVLSVDLALHGPDIAQIDLVNRLNALPGVLHNSVGPRSYTSLQTMLDEPSRNGLRSYWRAGYLNLVNPELLEALAQVFRATPSKDTAIILEHLHSAFIAPRRPSGFPARNARFSILVAATWKRAQADEENREWLESAWKVAARYLSDAPGYANYLSEFTPEARPRCVSSAVGQERLPPDPHGIFV
jgi:hypothetical protein